MIPLFVLDEDGGRPPGGASRWWLHRSLRALGDDLRAAGTGLVLRRGPAAAAVRNLARETGARTVFWNRSPEPATAAGDAALETSLASDGVEVRTFNTFLLTEPGAVLTGAGTPYRVFTPFWNRLREIYRPPPATRAITAIRPHDGIENGGLDDTGLPALPPDPTDGLAETWTPGEAAAHTRLGQFLADGLVSYPGDRDRPDLIGTSRLSPHLHWGEIGPAEVWRTTAALRTCSEPDAEAAEAFLRELAWREFNHHLMFYWPEIATRNWRDRLDSFPWRSDPHGLDAWRRGLTGYPMVDAGMRELRHTGWMHNRVRMVAASFLVKHLLVDWREGEAWFWDMLVDADPANNPGNWQWVAGSGADAAPYHRIFNPVLQGKKFDPDGAYVRRWIPEIAALPDRWIHKPWTAPPDRLAASGIALGETYPAPIVDHAAARERALAALSRAQET